MTGDVTQLVTYPGSYFMWFCGSVTEWLHTPFIIHYANTQDSILSHSHKLWAWLAISTAEIWDVCNYRTIHSNQPDPNLYFPEAPARLLASSYLPGRHSAHLRFLIRPWLKLFQQRWKKTVQLCRWLLEGERFQNINTDGLLIQTSHSVVSQLGVFYLFIYLLSRDSCLTFYLDFLLFRF